MLDDGRGLETRHTLSRLSDLVNYQRATQEFFVYACKMLELLIGRCLDTLKTDIQEEVRSFRLRSPSACIGT